MAQGQVWFALAHGWLRLFTSPILAPLPGKLLERRVVGPGLLAHSITASKNGASIHITPQGGDFFLFTDEGNLIRAQLSPAGYREISRAHLIDPTWPFAERKFVYAPPAFANGHIFARNEGEVVCASLKRSGNKSPREDQSQKPQT